MRATRLVEFLAASAAEPFVWGVRDCSLWPCEWIERMRGVDPAAGLRQRYGSALGCGRLLRASGGLEALARAIGHAAGLRETATPADGDIVLARVDRGKIWFDLALGIAHGGHAVFKAPRGLTAMDVAPIAAWEV
jgi:hypothetical protein